MFPVCFIKVELDIDILDQIVFRMIQFYIKYLEIQREIGFTAS